MMFPTGRDGLTATHGLPVNVLKAAGTKSHQEHRVLLEEARVQTCLNSAGEHLNGSNNVWEKVLRSDEQGVARATVKVCSHPDCNILAKTFLYA